MKASKPLFAVQAVLTALLVLSASIAVPILCRPFYYAHIPSIQAFTGVRWRRSASSTTR